MRILRLQLFLLALLPVCAQAEDTWVSNDSYLRGAIKDCAAAGPDRTVCRHFTGEALVRLFGIGDFCTESRCLKAVEIEWELRNTPDKWGALGTANSQAVLDKARELSASGKAVLAVQNNDDRGQIGIIMPGAAVPSGKWGLNVPIAVAARVDRPEASFYGKGINWLFSDPAHVAIYVHLQ
ncbi:MAG TPA: hypothetical protein VIU02_12220 [Burkholderiales bacterium]